MELNIPPHEIEKLSQHAAAAGFDSVETYVTHFVRTLAERPRADEVFAPLADDQLAASLAMIDRGMAEIDSGGGITPAEARRRTHQDLGAGEQ